MWTDFQNLVRFLDFRISQDSVAIYCRWGGNLCGDLNVEQFVKFFRQVIRKKIVYVNREFSCESPPERILKIGPHLPTLWSNKKRLTFWDTA